MPSFDVVSEVDLQEVRNAVDQANREVGTRFDFKGVDAKFEQSETEITLQAEQEFQLNQMMDILRQKLVKRKVDIGCMDIKDPESSLNAARQRVVIKQGIVGETYNIGGNEEHANLDIVNRLCAGIDGVFAADEKLAGRFPNAPAASGTATSSLVTMVKDRPGHDLRYAVNASRIHSELGYAPAHDFDAGLRSTVAWMLAFEDWWRAILDDSYRGWIEDQYEKR